MHRALLSWSLTKASAPGEEAFAASCLPRLERAVPRNRRGAALARNLVGDERWAARYVGARALGRLAPEPIAVDEAWAGLLTLAGDRERTVREGAAAGLAELVTRAPETAPRLERVLTDPAAGAGARRAAVRSLIVLSVQPQTAELGARLLRAAALAGDRSGRGLGAGVIGRGIAAQDRDRALGIAREWAASAEPALRAQGERALRGPLAGAA